MASLGAAGWEDWEGEKLLVEDSNLLGQAETFFEVLRRAESVHGFRMLTLFEDDVVVAKTMLSYVRTFVLDEDLALVSWFCRRRPRATPELVHLEVEAAHEFAYNQATTMSVETVRKLLSSEALKHWPSRHGADTLVGAAMPGAKVARHFPNLVDHVGGGRSLVGSMGLQRSGTFVGEDFDAATLRP